MITLILTNTAGSFDLTGLMVQLTWSGDYRQGARKITFTALSGGDLPDLAPGGLVQLYEGGTLLFSGVIISRSRDTGEDTVQVTAYDRGFYLLKNQGVYQFRGRTADAIARQICSDFGVTAGSLAPGTVPVSRNFIGVTLYRIIMTAYTEQARADAGAYQIRFRGDALEVIPVEVNEESVVLEGSSNLQALSMQDSIENTVTRAAVYDADNRLVSVRQSPGLEELYGLLQRVIRQPDGGDASAEAQKLLDDHGLAQTIRAEALGDVRCITGNTAALHEPVTGLYGLFWITSDKHVWKDGQHYMELGLSYKRLMDEQEAGSLPKAASGGSSGKVALDLTQYETLGGSR